MSSSLRALSAARAVRCAAKPPASLRRVVLPSQRENNRSYATAIQPRPAEPKPVEQAEQGSEDLTDPNMNGNYPDPSLTSALPIKRQFRDPYADWWDKQERRNYGEPVHEDNDILGIFSPEEYTHVKPGWGAVQVATFIAAFTSLVVTVSFVYPDKPAAPRTFVDGLEAELGGPGALRARKQGEDKWVAE